MKKIALIIVIILMATPSVWAENTHSIDLEASNSQYLSGQSLNITGDITLEAWIQFESTKSINAICGEYDSVGINNRSFRFEYQGLANHRLYLLISSDGTLYNYDTATVDWTPSLNTSYHVAVSYNASNGEVKFYVDGSQQGETQFISENSIYNGTAAFEIGSWQNGSNSFDGKIDDFRVWNIVRTETQINTNKNVELSGAENDLVGYWKLNNNFLDEVFSNNLTSKNNPNFSDPLFTSSTPPDPEPVTCTIVGNPINTNSAENLEGAGTNQLLTLGVDSSEKPVVCVSNVSDGSHLKTCEYGLDNTNTATSVFYISTTNEITITYYNANGDEYLLKYDYDTDTLGTPVELP